MLSEKDSETSQGLWGTEPPRNLIPRHHPQEPQDASLPSSGAGVREPGTHTGWEHSGGLQARRMALGFETESQKPRCTILWSSLRRQPYLVNWDPEDESLRGLNGTAWALPQAWRGSSSDHFSPALPVLLMGRGWGRFGQVQPGACPAPQAK